MIDLPKKTEYIRVRHCRLVTTPQLEKRKHTITTRI